MESWIAIVIVSVAGTGGRPRIRPFAGRTFDGLGLDAVGAGTANGTQIELWSRDGGSNQQWIRS